MQNPTARGTGCTVQVLNGSFCDSDGMPDAPFPICAHHARRLFEHMAYVLEQESRQPYRRQEAVVAFIDAQRQAAGQSDSSGRPLVSQVYYLMIDGMVKIGTTDDLATRLKGYPPTARVLATEPGGRDLEQERHQQFAALLTHGREWFTPGPDLRAHIEALPDYRAA